MWNPQKNAIFSAAKKTAARDQKTYNQNPFQRGSRRGEKIEDLSGLDPLIAIAPAQRYWQLATSKLLHHILDPCRTKLQKLEQIRADSEKLWSRQFYNGETTPKHRNIRPFISRLYRRIFRFFLHRTVEYGLLSLQNPKNSGKSQKFRSNLLTQNPKNRLLPQIFDFKKKF